MDIQGLQKMTLLDYPGRVACTVFLGGCDLRCPFCHNGGLVLGPMPSELDSEELLAFLRKRRGLLDGVCVTGGEPLLRPDLPELLSQIKELGYPVKLDTNGSQANRLISLAEKGLLDYVAMDIKNSPEKYAMTAGLAEYSLENVRESVRFLMSGVLPFEFRTTVVREFHKREDFASIGRWLEGPEKYFLQSFVDSGDLIRPGLRAYTKEILLQALEIVKEHIPNAELRGVD